MTGPIWLDEHGKPMATRPCPRCGVPTPVGRTFRLEHLRMIGWRLFTEEQIVQWCGHDHHFLVVPDAAGERAVLVPILGEAGVTADPPMPSEPIAVFPSAPKRRPTWSG